MTTPKPNIIPLISSILEELTFSLSAPLSQRMSSPKINTVPPSFSDLEKPFSFLSVSISTLSSHTFLNHSLGTPILIDFKWQYICNFDSFLVQLKLEEFATCNEKSLILSYQTKCVKHVVVLIYQRYYTSKVTMRMLVFYPTTYHLQMRLKKY